MNPIRRSLLQGTLASSVLTVALAAGLLRPGRVLAAPIWPRIFPEPEPAQPSSELHEALKAMQTSQPIDSKAVSIKAPAIAEDGANVFLEISTSLPDVDVLAVFVEQNPQRLVSAFKIAPEVMPTLHTRVKVARSSRIWVVVRSAGRFHKAFADVKVTVGGCGVGVN